MSTDKLLLSLVKIELEVEGRHPAGDADQRCDVFKKKSTVELSVISIAFSRGDMECDGGADMFIAEGNPKMNTDVFSTVTDEKGQFGSVEFGRSRQTE